MRKRKSLCKANLLFRSRWFSYATLLKLNVGLFVADEELLLEGEEGEKPGGDATDILGGSSWDMLTAAPKNTSDSKLSRLVFLIFISSLLDKGLEERFTNLERKERGRKG